MEVIGVIITVLLLLFFFVYIPVVIIQWIVGKFKKLRKKDADYQEKISVIAKKGKESSAKKTDAKPVSNSIDVSNPKKYTVKSTESTQILSNDFTNPKKYTVRQSESTEIYQDDNMKPKKYMPKGIEHTYEKNVESEHSEGQLQNSKIPKFKAVKQTKE